MADNKRVQRNIGRLQRVKTWQLVILLIIFGLLAATFLRLNNVGMIERRTAVLSADKAGDKTSLHNNLYALQRWSASRMNASTGPVYLEHSYQRTTEKLLKEARESSTVERDVLNRADAVCRRQYAGNWQAYVQCNAAEQAKYRGSSGAASVAFPNPGEYRHEFASPIWSPDFAGWSLVICVLITGVIIARIISLLILKALLRKHYSSI